MLEQVIKDIYFVLQLDNAKCISFANSKALMLLGYPEDILLNMTEQQLVYENDLYTLENESFHDFNGYLFSESARRFKKQNGSSLWLSCSIIKNENGFIVIGTDITDIVAHNLDIDAQIGTIDRSHAVIEYDLNGFVLTANNNFLLLIGYSYREIIGMHHREFVDPSHALSDEYKEFWNKLRSGVYVSDEFKRIGKGGRELWIHATYNPVFDLDGNVCKIIKFAIDITEEKLRREEVKAKLNAIDTSQGVIEFSIDGIVTQINQNYLDLLGYTREEIIGMHHLFLCEPEYTQSDAYSKFWRDLRSGLYVRGRFKRLGKYKPVWIEATYNPIFDLNGKVIKVVKYAYDVTKEVFSEQLLAQQKTTLDLLNIAQQTFLIDKSLETACERIFGPLLKMTASRFGFIGILRQDFRHQTVMYVPIISNLSWDPESSDVNEQPSNYQQGITFTNFDNIFGHVILNQKPILTNDPSHHPANKGALEGHPVLTSFLGVPIFFGDTIVGMIGLANRPNGFDESIIQMLTPLISTLGVLIHARNLEDKRIAEEARLKSEAAHDSLTGLNNRRTFYQKIDKLDLLSPSAQTNHFLALLDIDLFKRINDNFGHPVGDQVLKEFSQQLTASLRSSDVIARIGGEEFAVVVSNITLSVAKSIFERIRYKIENLTVKTNENQPIKFTVSIGIKEWDDQISSVDEWLNLADKALYQAKQQGRNRIVFSNDK